MLTDCLLTTSIRIVSLKLMEMLRSFGITSINTGQYQPLPKAVRLTASLNNVLVILGGVSNMAPVWFWEVLMVAGISLPVVLGLLDERGR